MAVWNLRGRSPSWLQYYDTAGSPVGRTAIDVEGMSKDDQTPVHHDGKVVLISDGNAVKDKTHLITVDPATCTARTVRIAVQSPLNVTTIDASALTFDWVNGWAYLHRFGPDGTETGQLKLNDWVGLTGLAVSGQAAYAIANYGEEKKAYLLVLDRTTLQETRRVPLPQVVAEDGPQFSAIVGHKLYFPADRNGDGLDTALGVVDLNTFTTGIIDLETGSPYIVRAVGTTLYIAHTSMDTDGRQLTALDTTTGRLTHRDVGFDIMSIDVSPTTLAVVGHTDRACRDARLALYDTPDLNKLSDNPIHTPDPTSNGDEIAINVFVP